MASSRWRRLNPFRGDRKETAGNPSKAVEPPFEEWQGLKVVAQGDSPVVDIVAVHGLNGHRDKTWTAANSKHWLRDLLSNDIPNARIFCWGYDANTHSDRVSYQYLHNLIRSLVSLRCRC
ncbi:hypothetical protein K469DRAFT_639718 [Zopfia rhizophila CBS 207.26]|uniref:DUF676 domain-containing protein n=1 Tax=Zopfia rhizophila CBS 207.26 TaxID=1314779 RepID=A0A6A6DMF3_9PEZI|nr:hypothetical protein K469DRAFT_639718 [Zopfia rhizophila CBS 207.26]